MSLKAYNGMMTKNGLSYFYEETLKRIEKFKNASHEKLFNVYSEMIVRFFDEKLNPKSLINYYDFSLDKSTSKLIKEINLEKDLTLLSLIFQISNISVKSLFVNDFHTHLNISFQPKDDKLLIYPNLLVNEHKKILLEYLVDWHGQNQTDPPDDVNEKEWDERCNDWWNFNEDDGIKLKMVLFDPDNFMDSINKNLRGTELINGILSHIPQDEKRINNIALNGKLDEDIKNDLIPKNSMYDFLNKQNFYLRDDNGIQELNEYKLKNNISVIKITEELLDEKIGLFELPLDYSI
jgi:hypothetical protein